jgi:aspartate-semialdehyde dehydrogenase
MAGLRIAIVGATGLVGQTILQVLAERQWEIDTIVPLASHADDRSVSFRGQELWVEPLDQMDWSRVDVAFFAAGNPVSQTYAPQAVAHGVTVVDKSSYFRLDPEVPLVVPEVNLDAVGSKRLIASPNCSTIQLVVALHPIFTHYGLRRVIVSTYQAVSGTGREAMTTLRHETEQALQNQPITPSTYPTPIAFNVLAYCDAFGDQDYTGEEWKLMRETSKIFDQPIALSATAVRVPVYVGHAESVYVETERPFDLDEVKALLQAAPSVWLKDDPAHGDVPTPLDAAGQDQVLVGRVRQDPHVKTGLHLLVVADNLRKGAATNAIQIVEALRARWQ